MHKIKSGKNCFIQTCTKEHNEEHVYDRKVIHSVIREKKKKF